MAAGKLIGAAFLAGLAVASPLRAQPLAVALDRLDDLIPIKVAMSVDSFKGRKALRVEGGNDEKVLGRLVVLPGTEMGDGTIELEVAGEPGPGSFSEARGYVGVAFHVAGQAAELGDRFECLYIRPTNGRVENQVRRNHVTQYTSYPEWTWQRFRKEQNGRYESYADVVPGEWTHLKIEIGNGKARFYVGGADQPTLLVDDLKMGVAARGPVVLWVGLGTVAHFADLKITRR